MPNQATNPVKLTTRLQALAIDTSFITMIAIVIPYCLGKIFFSHKPSLGQLHPFEALMIGTLIILYKLIASFAGGAVLSFYAMFIEAKTGLTLGKKILGIRVRNEDSSACLRPRLFMRLILKYSPLFSFIYLVTYFYNEGVIPNFFATYFALVLFGAGIFCCIIAVILFFTFIFQLPYALLSANASFYALIIRTMQRYRTLFFFALPSILILINPPSKLTITQAEEFLMYMFFFQAIIGAFFFSCSVTSILKKKLPLYDIILRTNIFYEKKETF